MSFSRFVKEISPNIVLEEDLGETFHFEVPQSEISLSKLFKIIEDNREQYSKEDHDLYSFFGLTDPFLFLQILWIIPLAKPLWNRFSFVLRCSKDNNSFYSPFSFCPVQINYVVVLFPVFNLLTNGLSKMKRHFC